jgi:hypothetical protein
LCAPSLPLRSMILCAVSIPRNTQIPFPREHRTSQLFPSSSRRSATCAEVRIRAAPYPISFCWSGISLSPATVHARGACPLRPDPSTKNEFPARLSRKRSRRARFAARASNATSFPPGTRVARWHQTLRALERKLLICCTDGSRVNSEDEPVSRRGVLSEFSASRGTDLPKARDDAQTGLIPRGRHSVS